MSWSLEVVRVLNVFRILALGAVLAAVCRADEPSAASPLDPAEAAARTLLPPGFSASVFAAEPDLVQPIAFTFDDRGRLWVVECLSYPNFAADAPARDRVTIFTDRDGDGRMDERRVFWDQGRNLSGIEWGYGGVWLCSSPHLIFLPDRNHDDTPDGPPEIVLDGWDVSAKHNVFNGLVWGPDGWLYGCNGILSHSRVAPPGTPDAQRTALNCGVWRYHPISRRFEAVAHGTTNPWGLDFDDHGEMFITNCVIKHLFHVTPGAHFERMFGQDIAPYSFSLMPSCADHLHWAGGYWDTEGVDKPENDLFGGGHAHSGTMVYLGDNWPATYRNGVFTLNVHGRRMNHDRLVRRGSGFVAEHAPDVMRSAEPWFRGVALKYGPDGAVYVADWSDTGECHDYEDIQRDNGRIYRIVYGSPQTLAPFSLTERSDAELVALQQHPNDWWVRHARRLLAERAASGRDLTSVRKLLFGQFEAAESAPYRLRALWTLHVTGGISPESLRDRDEYVRAWAVRLLTDQAPINAIVLAVISDLATSDGSPLVRRELASSLGRLSPHERESVAASLLRRPEDADDPNLPYLVWYALGAHVAEHPDTALQLLAASTWPMVTNHLSRRLTLAGHTESVVRHLKSPAATPQRQDLLQGLAEALQGRRNVAPPAGWSETAVALSNAPALAVRRLSLLLSVQFGDARAAEQARAAALDPQADREFREQCLAMLVQQKTPPLPALLYRLLDDASLRPAAIRALAACDEPDTPDRLLARYDTLTPGEKSDAIATLASRRTYALALVAALEAGAVPRNDVSPFIARQLAAMNDADLADRLARVWGALRPASEDKARLKPQYLKLLTAERLAAADLANGRQVFNRQCAACHRMFDAGARIGPELTGAQRGNLDYILDNVLDPSTVVPRDYLVTNFQTTDGRIVSGIIRQENPDAVTVQTANDLVVIPAGEIETREPSKLSMMPEGLFANLTPEEIRDLVAYLASPSQVP